ncbi:prostaglandin E synthase 3-like [Actinia tenebrosa]|uniref:Prostaglandin E synthase 3-like n=1 Tax=Actinia tenebrosa TaxID=6105 RepID=A0A6P8IA38_ACTTE|nr:prostaglandin E synthase 3-like [Actinia tenebrosa]
MDSELHPPILWAQRKDRVLVTISLEDCKNPEIKLTETKLTFSSKGGHEQKLYKVELEFYNEVDPKESKQLVGGREIYFDIKKKDEGPFWPRLLKETKKPHYVRVDFNRWRDEDDSDIEDNYTDNRNLEDMMKNMGSSGLGEKFDPGEADSDDSDDEELPDLED